MTSAQKREGESNERAMALYSCGDKGYEVKMSI